MPPDGASARALHSEASRGRGRSPTYREHQLTNWSECMNSAAEALTDVATVTASGDYAGHRVLSSAQPHPPIANAYARVLPAHLDARRALNVVIAAVALVISAPLMLIIAALVKLSSPGPVIYRQTRVGVDRRQGDASPWHGRRKVDYGGRLFTIYKFRTMTSCSDNKLQ